MPAWIVPWNEILLWLAAISLVFFVASIVVIPYAALRIPADYFQRYRNIQTARHSKKHIKYYGIAIAKNTIGIILILAGLAMLVLPGQGLITIFFGLVLMDFPKKHELESYVISRPAVLQTINWMRRRGGVPELRLFNDSGSS